MVFIYKGNSSATAESKLLVIGGSGGLTSSLARQMSNVMSYGPILRVTPYGTTANIKKQLVVTGSIPARKTLLGCESQILIGRLALEELGSCD